MISDQRLSVSPISQLGDAGKGVDLLAESPYFLPLSHCCWHGLVVRVVALGKWLQTW